MIHCGWSSTLEVMVFGVQIIATLLHLDQLLNAKLVVEIGVGMEVKRVNERIEMKEMAKVIKMVVEKEGKEVRRKAKELGEKLRVLGLGLSISSSPMVYKKMATSKMKFDEDLMV